MLRFLALVRYYLLIDKQYPLRITSTTIPSQPNLIQQLHPHFVRHYTAKPVSAAQCCWKCGLVRRPHIDLFCEQCKAIQPPPRNTAGNYFKVFALDEKFDIDLVALTGKYRQMQSLLHPDKFSNKTDEEKEISQEFSSLLNKAYKVLQIPLERALHLLQLRGDSSINESLKVNDDPQFLMEIMELNEEVETADTEEKLRGLNEKNRLVLKGIAETISRNFSENHIDKARKNIIKMKYYTSLGDSINSLMRERGIVD